MSQREILTINIGQCGINIGNAVWEQYCGEHQIDKSGNRKYRKDGPTKTIYPHYVQKDSPKYNHSISSYFEEVSEGRFIARNIMIDTEPNVIDDITTSDFAHIYDPNFFVKGREDAANNFARGYFSIGKEMIDKINDKIRKLTDHCDNVQGFVISRAVAGGSGSGLGSLILEHLTEYKKKSKFGFEVYPSPTISTCVVEPYNAILTTHWSLDYTDISVVLDNEAIYEICQKWLDRRRPSYNNLNRLINKIISSITIGIRFDNDNEIGGNITINSNLQEFQTNLVPFPRLHFMISSLAPVGTRRCCGPRIDVQGITESCFSAQHFFTKIADFDAEEDKYMAISANYRGDVKAKEANATCQWLKTNKKVSFVEWCPTGFKVGTNAERLHVDYDKDDIAASRISITMLGNNTAISRVFSERISKKYDLMYSQKSYIHWYVAEGMEEGEFVEAREDLGFLERDYLDVLLEMSTDATDATDVLD